MDVVMIVQVWLQKGEGKRYLSFDCGFARFFSFLLGNDRAKVFCFWSNLRNDSSLLCLPAFFLHGNNQSPVSIKLNCFSFFPRQESQNSFWTPENAKNELPSFCQIKTRASRNPLPEERRKRVFLFCSFLFFFSHGKERRRKARAGVFLSTKGGKPREKEERRDFYFFFFDFDGGGKRVEGGWKGKRQILLFFFRGRRWEWYDWKSKWLEIDDVWSIM